MQPYMTEYLKEQDTRINKKEKKSGSVYINKYHFPYIMWSTPLYEVNENTLDLQTFPSLKTISYGESVRPCPVPEIRTDPQVRLFVVVVVFFCFCLFVDHSKILL